MYGGIGNDTYVVDNSGDVATKPVGTEPTRFWPRSLQPCYSLHAIGSVENLTLTGNSAINATGNARTLSSWQ